MFEPEGWGRRRSVMSTNERRDDLDCDLLVIGAGAAGLSGAVTAAYHGLRVIVAEKASVLGGATSWSGGWMWVPLNPLSQADGIVEDIDSPRTYRAPKAARRSAVSAGPAHWPAVTALLTSTNDGGLRFASSSNFLCAARRSANHDGNDGHHNAPGCGSRSRYRFDIDPRLSLARSRPRARCASVSMPLHQRHTPTTSSAERTDVRRLPWSASPSGWWNSSIR